MMSEILNFTRRFWQDIRTFIFMSITSMAGKTYDLISHIMKYLSDGCLDLDLPDIILNATSYDSFIVRRIYNSCYIMHASPSRHSFHHFIWGSIYRDSGIETRWIHREIHATISKRASPHWAQSLGSLYCKTKIVVSMQTHSIWNLSRNRLFITMTRWIYHVTNLSLTSNHATTKK